MAHYYYEKQIFLTSCRQKELPIQHMCPIKYLPVFMELCLKRKNSLEQH